MNEEPKMQESAEQAIQRIIIENYPDGNVKVQFPHLPPVILMGLIEFAKHALIQQMSQGKKIHLAPASFLHRIRNGHE